MEQQMTRKKQMKPLVHITALAEYPELFAINSWSLPYTMENLPWLKLTLNTTDFYFFFNFIHIAMG